MSSTRSARLLFASLLLAGTSAHAEQAVTLLGLGSSVPEAWQLETPSSDMRLLQSAIPAADGDAAAFVVFYFGPEQGGTLEANVERWQSQFQGPEGTAVEPHISEIGTAALPATLVELRGSYGRSVGMGPGGDMLPDRMLLAAVVETPQGTLYPQLHGPAMLVAEQRDAFIAFVRGLQPLLPSR